jgi:hypothetical protein
MIYLYNAHLITLDPEQPVATGLAIEGERIVALVNDPVDSLAALTALTHPFSPTDTRSVAIDMEGQTILPGLTDAHIHLEQYALGLQKVDCETATRAECLQRVAEQVPLTPTGDWILGHGWNQNDWPEGFGSRELLDAVAPQHPVYLTAKSLHAAWANSLALQRAGITAQTPDPPGGRFGRQDNGQPDGILFESAMQPVAGAIPDPSVEQVAGAIHAAQPALWQMGLTGVHDFDRARCFSALQQLHAAGELGLRVVKSIPLELLPQAAELGLRSGFGDDWLRIGSVKAFADGALGPRTAAMLQPYEGEPDNRGILMLDAEELSERGRVAVENGLSLAVHAIGDRAIHEVLDALHQLRLYEGELQTAARQGHRQDRRQSRRQGRRSSSQSAGWVPTSGWLRHRIEHVQLIHPDDAGRLAEMGIIASMQPVHAPSDMRMADRFWGARAAFAYAWREQLRHGAFLAFGSDAPVESPNPFLGLHAAVTRQRLDGSPGPQGWYPEQRLSLLEALRGFTTGAAFAAGMEDRLGKLVPGYLADLLVLELNPFLCEPAELAALQPRAVMIAGQWVSGTPVD